MEKFREKIGIITAAASVLMLAGCSLTGGGNDGGIFRSDDGGKTFMQKAAAEQDKSINNLDVLSIANNPQDGRVVYVGTKSTGIFKSEDGGDLWKQLEVAELAPTKIYAIAVDPVKPDTLFATAAIDGRGKIVKSEDAGQTWKEVYSEPSDKGLVLSLAINPQMTQNVYAGTDQGQIIFSEDGGTSWRNLLWTEGNKAVYKIGIDRTNPQLAYFLLFQSGVLRTLDGGQSFEELQRNSGEETFSFDSTLDQAISLEVDPTRSGWLYVGNGEGLLRSKDQGESWEVVKTLNNPEDISIRSIAVNPKNPNEIICSAAQAFYKSNDGGVNWMPIQFQTQRSPEIVKYNSTNPEQIFVGMNNR